MSDYRAALLIACSALAIILGLLAAKELDYRLRRLEVGRRKRRRKGLLP